ncbi:MAG TPA: 50S ribosomal protein L21 [Candidatus Dormibacteraeota bacterium]|nr:50S ribosomal protein L21 [Candidatus Dormibacteraeota bacterium]
MSGGKQYRVAPGDRILVDRLAAEPGTSIKLGRVLLLSDGKDVKVGSQTDGLEVEAKVIAHRRGPRIESIRYKSKKHVRVHHGGRAHLTALEIIAVGGVGIDTGMEEEETPTKGRGRGRAKAAPRKKKVEARAEVAEKAVAKKEVVKKAEKPEETSKPARRRSAKKEAE